VVVISRDLCFSRTTIPIKTRSKQISKQRREKCILRIKSIQTPKKLRDDNRRYKRRRRRRRLKCDIDVVVAVVVVAAPVVNKKAFLSLSSSLSCCLCGILYEFLGEK
tara:strand:+ start:44 stop:364 length:321 start_codon:yes stop_codon:yes gene_type:complete